MYRLRVAVQLLADCVPDPGPGTAGWRAPLASAADFVARRLETIDSPDLTAEARFQHNLAELRRMALGEGLDGATRLALLRAVTALERIALVVASLTTMQDGGPAPPSAEAGDAPAPETAPPPRRRGLSPAARVALQGLIATAITTALDFTIGLNHAYWATMTVMFVIGNSVGETFNRVRYRTAGTLVGVALGIAGVLVLDQNVWLLAGACLAGQMIGLLTLRDRYDIASAATALSVVVGLHLVTGLGASGMLARIYETAIGAAVALLVAYLILPVYLTDQLASQLEGMVRRCRAAFAARWPGSGEAPAFAGMVRELRAMTDRVPHLGAESTLGHAAVGDLTNIVGTLDVLLTYLALIDDAAIRLSRLHLPPEMLTAVEAARARTLSAFDSALGEAAPDTRAASAPALQAAVSSALETAQDEAGRRVLPFVADYLAYSDATLRPLGDMAKVLAAVRPAPRPKLRARADRQAARAEG